MKAIALVVFLITSLPVQAEIFRGPISSALGGAGVAGIPASEGALLNPALVPISRESGVDGYFRDGELGSGQHRTSVGLGAIDNAPDVWFPGSLHYIRSRDFGRAEGAVNGELWHGAMGQQIDHLALGLSVYRLRYDFANGANYTQWNGALGAVYMFTPNVGIGYVLQNPIHPSSEVPLGLREDLQQSLGFLAGVGELARARVDFTRQEHFNPSRKLAYMMGFESKTSKLVVLRLGFKYDDLANQRLWTAGFAFDGPRLKLDYSFEKSQDSGSGALHSVDLRLPF